MPVNDLSAPRSLIEAQGWIQKTSSCASADQLQTKKMELVSAKAAAKQLIAGAKTVAGKLKSHTY